MADIELPQPGEYPWEHKLNQAITEINEDVESRVKTINGLSPDSAGNIVVSASGGGMLALQMAVEVPVSTWVFTFPDLGRMPSVSIFLSTGEAVDADVTATTSAVSVSFPSPQSGWLIIT